MKQKDKDFDLRKVKELIALMEAHSLAEIEITHNNDKIFLKRTGVQPTAISELEIEQHPAESSNSNENLEDIKSPTPGTFYISPGPDADPYVEIGSMVDPQTTVCTIEAMKVMNQISAGITGRIVEILAENGQAIEYGQPLFKVRSE